MEGKSTGAIMATIFFTIVCAIVGSCFMAFVYEHKKVIIVNPKIILDSGISVRTESQSNANSLVLSKALLGLKPATGKEDAVTHIPFTITDTIGTEGQYAKFFVTSASDYNVYVKNINVEGQEDATGERKHICVGIKNEKETTKTLEEDKVLLYSGTPTEKPKELTFFVWLHAHAGQKLIGSKISFDLSFEVA